MSSNREALLTIRSESDAGITEQEVTALIYGLEHQIILRYVEQGDSEAGITTSTIKLSPSQIRVLRHGEVEAVQTFIVNAATSGYFISSGLRLSLLTFTNNLVVNKTEHGGDASWEYDLQIDDSPSGRHRVVISYSFL